MKNLALSLLLFAISMETLAAAGVARPRGVPLSKASFYKENEPFTCLDGSATLPWSKVNDDYCDCRDASDEPGTAACSNGVFFCENKDFKGRFIPSSRVNDGLCDCCDGSDEYSGIAVCRNECWEIGKAAREEAERRKKMMEEGHRVFREFAEQVKASLEAKKQRAEQLEVEIQDLSSKRTTLEEAKKEAEDPEKEAKEAHEKAWEATKAERNAERSRKEAEAAFTALDTNRDFKVSVEELQARMELDADSDGVVSPEEVKNYMESEMVMVTEFKEKVWPLIMSLYKKAEEEKKAKEAAPPAAKAEAGEEEKGDKSDEEKPEGEKVDHAESSEEKEKPESGEDQMPDFDEATKKLIEVADAARKAFNEVDQKISSLENEKEEIKKLMDRDYGPDNVYFKLAESSDCFEYTDREYTYKLCPFKETTQRSKDGGAETSLGHWGRWSGPDSNKYAEMLYDNGQSCWNGPNRSTRVAIKCGAEHKVEAASEPSRCEYMFVFATPAACSTNAEEASKDPDHDEL